MSDSMDIAVATDHLREVRRTLQAINGCPFNLPDYELDSAIDMLTRLANNAAIIRHEAVVAKARALKAKRAFDRDMRKALRS